MIDSDLRGIFVFHPKGAPGADATIHIDRVSVPVEYAGAEEYGEPPYRFRAVRQNGSRLHLRLLRPDGTDARYEKTREFIERRVYTSDVRRGSHWTRENDPPSQGDDAPTATGKR